MILGIIAGGMRRGKASYLGVIASTFAKTSKYANDATIDFRAPSTTYPAMWHQNYDETNSFGLYVTTESTGWTPTGDKTFNCSPNDVFTLQVSNGSSSDTISTMSLDFMTEDNTVLYRILYTKYGLYATSVLAGPPSALVERKGDKMYPNPKGRLTLSQSEVSWVDSQPSTAVTYTPPFTSSVDLSQLKKLRVYNLRSIAPGGPGTFAYLIQNHRLEPARVIQSLFDQGQQGFWLPFTDFASLSQDSAGTLPYTALEQPVGRVLDRSGRGNHASQPTSTARGVVSARVNWLAKSEALSVSPWSVFGGVVVSDGASSSTLTFGAGLGGVTQSVQVFPPASNLGATFTLKLIANTPSRVLFWGGASAAGTDVVSITPLGGGEWLQTVARTFTSTSGGNPQFQINNSVVGNGAVVIVRACSFVLPQQATLPYQRVNTHTDYDAVGFPKYARLDGVDDFYTCGGGGSTTGFYYSDVIRPINGAGTRRVIWSDRSGNNGYELAINAANKLEFSAGNGTAITTVASTVSATVAEGKHYEVMDDGTNLSVQIDGSAPVTVARPVVAAGSSTITLYRGASTYYFKGQITEPIYRAGPPPSAYERGVIRAYQMQKAGL